MDSSLAVSSTFPRFSFLRTVTKREARQIFEQFPFMKTTNVWKKFIETGEAADEDAVSKSGSGKPTPTTEMTFLPSALHYEELRHTLENSG
jgi:hypothetical protein